MMALYLWLWLWRMKHMMKCNSVSWKLRWWMENAHVIEGCLALLAWVADALFCASENFWRTCQLKETWVYLVWLHLSALLTGIRKIDRIGCKERFNCIVWSMTRNFWTNQVKKPRPLRSESSFLLTWRGWGFWRSRFLTRLKFLG